MVRLVRVEGVFRYVRILPRISADHRSRSELNRLLLLS